MPVLEIILAAALAYAGAGLLFAAWFVTVGVGRFDHAARGATWGFRLVIVPGVVALWPYLARRVWLQPRGGKRA